MRGIEKILYFVSTSTQNTMKRKFHPVHLIIAAPAIIAFILTALNY